MNIRTEGKLEQFLNIKTLNEYSQALVKVAYIVDVKFGNSKIVGPYLTLTIMDCYGALIRGMFFRLGAVDVREIQNKLTNKIAIIKFDYKPYEGTPSIILMSEPDVIEDDETITISDFLSEVEGYKEYVNRFDGILKSITNPVYRKMIDIAVVNGYDISFCRQPAFNIMQNRIGGKLYTYLKCFDIIKLLSSEEEFEKLSTMLLLVQMVPKKISLNLYDKARNLVAILDTVKDELLKNEILNLFYSLEKDEKPRTVRVSNLCDICNSVSKILRLNSESAAIPKGGYIVEKEETNNNFIYNY